MTGMLLMEGQASGQLLQRLLSGPVGGQHTRVGWMRVLTVPSTQ